MWTVYRRTVDDHISVVAIIFTSGTDAEAFVKYLTEKEEYNNEYWHQFSYRG